MPIVIVKIDFRIWMFSNFIEPLNFVYYLINKYLAINSFSDKVRPINRKIRYVE